MMKKMIFNEIYSMQIDNAIISACVDASYSLPTLPDDYYLHLHMHPYCELFLCTEDELSIITPHDKYSLSHGDIAIVPSGLLHQRLKLQPNASKSHLGFFIEQVSNHNLHSNNLYALFEHLNRYNEILLFKQSEHNIKTDTLIEYLNKEESSHLLLLELAHVLLQLPVVLTHQTYKQPKHLAKNMDRLLRLQQILTHDYAKPLSNKLIAEELNIGVRQLNRLIDTSYNCSFQSLLLQKRMAVAARLLVETSHSVVAIAQMVGYNHMTSFYKEFKKIYQLTPNQYRNQK